MSHPQSTQGTMHVCVSPGPPDFEEELADCTAELGETVKLACRVTGTPKPIVSWYKGRPQRPGTRILQQARAAQREQAGQGLGPRLGPG